MTHWYEATTQVMEQAGLTWRAAPATIDTCLTPWIRKRGDTLMNVHFTTAEYLTWEAQMGCILMAGSDPGASREEILASLPTVEDIVRGTITYDEVSQTHAICTGHITNLFYRE
jgi:hypothetical protein